MRIFFLMFLTSLFFSASAEELFELESDAELTVILAIGDNDSASDPSESAQTELAISTTASRVLENGAEISGHLAFRAQTDHPARPGFSGAIEDCPPTLAVCPSLNGQGVRGGFSRIGSVGSDEDTGPRGSLELAFLSVDGGWGEVVLGRDSGVAARFYEGGPTVFRIARDHDAILDPAGINAARTRNDISSTAEKISYVSPRLLGIRAGVSYTPDASVRRLDLNTSYTHPGISEPELDDAFEVGLQASRLLREADLRLRGSLTWSKAMSASPFYDDTETVSLGLDVERRDQFRLGFSALNSSNGGLGDYQSLAAGAEVYWNDWRLGLNGTSSEDELLQLDASSTTIGASRDLNDHISFTIGYRNSQTRLKSMPSLLRNNLDQGKVLLELRIRK